MGSCVFQGELSLDCDFRRVTDIRTLFLDSGLDSLEYVCTYLVRMQIRGRSGMFLVGFLGDFIPAVRGKTDT
jgi:hypothetical protein